MSIAGRLLDWLLGLPSLDAASAYDACADPACGHWRCLHIGMRVYPADDAPPRYDDPPDCCSVAKCSCDAFVGQPTLLVPP